LPCAIGQLWFAASSKCEALEFSFVAFSKSIVTVNVSIFIIYVYIDSFGIRKFDAISLFNTF
jgi:hypothetical protein